ncbi:MAG: hypothetical protein J6R91_04625 [Bacteroidaceae bacterium]|nr:hypothetical protein [Bacteroidaceae bacterium]
MRTFITILFISLFITSCEESYFNEDNKLSVSKVPRYLKPSKTKIVLDSYNDNSEIIKIESVETPWALEDSIEWISLSKMSGNTSESITISASENPYADQKRLGIITLESTVEDWYYRTPISITQDYARPNIQLSETVFNLSGGSNSLVVDVIANYDWKYQSSNDWITVRKEGNQLFLDVSANEGQYSRQGTVYINPASNIYGMQSRSITIYQEVALLNGSTDEIKFTQTAGVATITITSETKWSASTSESWIEVSPTQGIAGEAKLEISVAPNTSINERTGFVVLYVGDQKKLQIPVKQEGLYLRTDLNELSFNYKSDSQEIEIISNATWEVSSSVPWLIASVTSGEGTKKIKIEVEENTSTNGRTGTLKIFQSGLDLCASISVNQSGMCFNIGTSVLYFDDKASTQTVNIESDGKWHANSLTNWLNYTPQSAYGNSTIDVSVNENKNYSERIGVIDLSMSDKTLPLQVIQQGKYFDISNEELSFESRGGSLVLTVSTNDRWTIAFENAVSWLTFSAMQGEGTQDIIITAKDNPSVNDRSAVFLFNTENGDNLRVEIKQKARMLCIDSEELLFYAKGGKSQDITVTTDGTYKIDCSDSWFRVQQVGNVFNVVALKNLTPEHRTGKVTIMLTDLEEGSYTLSIPVFQLGEGGAFIKQGFNDDTNFDDGSDSFELDINYYDSDTNWNDSSGSSVTLIVTKYSSDKNWNNPTNQKLTIERTGYSADNNYNANNNGNGDVSKDSYTDDKNQDKQNNPNSDLDKEGHSSDENYDANKNGDSNVSKDSYTDDKNQDKQNNPNSDLDKEGHSSDNDYDANKNGNSNVSKDSYTDDKNQDKQNNPNSDLGKEGHSSDNDYDANKNGNSNVSKDSYTGDKNHDKQNNSKSGLDKEGYSADKNWN